MVASSLSLFIGSRILVCWRAHVPEEKAGKVIHQALWLGPRQGNVVPACTEGVQIRRVDQANLWLPHGH